MSEAIPPAERRPVALLDANVLYSAMLRELMLAFAAAGLFSPRWSGAIHAEWLSALARNNSDYDPQALARVPALLDEAFPEADVTHYVHAVTRLYLPDPGDRHVLAAAVAGGADTIVTRNLRDFPPRLLARHGVGVASPDRFLAGLLTQEPTRAVAAIKALRLRLGALIPTADAFLTALRRQSLPATLKLLRQHRQAL